ncbi:MAG TPA: M28 family peptidase [Chthoniobacteraceae bacterium]
MIGLASFGCKKTPPPQPPPAATPASETPAATPAETPKTMPAPNAPPPAAPAPPPPVTHTAPPPAEIWKEFSAEKAMEQTKKQVDVGPRPSGSADLEKARVLITDSLKSSGWDVERQEFNDDTPRGSIHFVNLIARFSANGVHPAPSNTQTAIVSSHYDTKRYSLIRFLGACDGASSTGALLELARVLAMDPAMAAKIELVFFDGEEAIEQFTETDGLWGSRHYASDLLASGRNRQFKFAILWDMLGDKDLDITLPPDSPANLAKGIFAASEALGLRKNFSYLSRDITDDHVPLGRIARIPAIDLIDFNYVYWHTADDTLDKINPESLRKAGAVTLYFLRQNLGR